MPQKAAYTSTLPKRMGIELPSAVSFAVTAYDMASDGRKMSGSMQVAANIISLTHLWNTIRVQGGSYGASMSAGRTGGLLCYTYRDPSPARSLGVYKTIPEFLSSMASEDAVIDGYIISTIASTEPLISPAAKGRAADDFYLSGFSDEDRIRIRREILETKVSDLADMCSALNDMTENCTVCVAGPKSALEACEELKVFAL